jgi:hypothetical protein
VHCAEVTVGVPAEARVLLIATVDPQSIGATTGGSGHCRLGSSFVRGGSSSFYTPIDGTTRAVRADTNVSSEEVSLIAVAGPFPAGTGTFGVDCSEDDSSDIAYGQARISAVALSAS